MEYLLIGYIIFQLIVYYREYCEELGASIEHNTKFNTERFLADSYVLTMPVLNIVLIINIFIDKNFEYSRKHAIIGFKAQANFFHYLILALPVLALVSLFFVEI